MTAVQNQRTALPPTTVTKASYLRSPESLSASVASGTVVYFCAHPLARLQFERSCLGAAASSTREGELSSISSVYLLRDFLSS